MIDNGISLAYDAPMGPQPKPVPIPKRMLEILPEITDTASPVNPDHNEMERSLIGAILHDPLRWMPYCKKIGLQVQAFQDARRRKIYKTLLRFFKEKKHIDAVIIANESSYSLSILNEYLFACDIPMHGGYYADQVFEHYAKRKLGDLSIRIGELSKNNNSTQSSIKEIETQLELIKPAETHIVIRSLSDFAEMPIDPADTLLGSRFLCREGGMLFIGPSGVGKSSASVQQDILWALGEPAFGIYPARPLRIATVQAENDDGDLTEMAKGISDGLDLKPEEREIVKQNTFYISEKSKISEKFIEFLEEVLRQTRPDILRIDPLQSYIGGDTSDAEVISDFVHVGLNPLLQRYQCSCIVNHHTPKTTNRDSSKWKQSDWQYAGAGSAILTNWARAIMIVDPCKENPHLFRFIAAKRGWRAGWHDENDVPTIFKLFKHAREDGVIFWKNATENEINESTAVPKTALDMIDLVPATEPIPKDALIEKARTIGIGINKARKFINQLIASQGLFEWHIDRPGTRQQIELARVHQP